MIINNNFNSFVANMSNFEWKPTTKKTTLTLIITTITLIVLACLVFYRLYRQKCLGKINAHSSEKTSSPKLDQIIAKTKNVQPTKNPNPIDPVKDLNTVDTAKDPKSTRFDKDLNPIDTAKDPNPIGGGKPFITFGFNEPDGFKPVCSRSDFEVTEITHLEQVVRNIRNSFVLCYHGMGVSVLYYNLNDTCGRINSQSTLYPGQESGLWDLVMKSCKQIKTSENLFLVHPKFDRINGQLT